MRTGTFGKNIRYEWFLTDDGDVILGDQPDNPDSELAVFRSRQEALEFLWAAERVLLGLTDE